MKGKHSSFYTIVLTIIFAMLIMSVPSIFFKVQDARFLKKENSIETKTININKMYFSSLSIEDRINLIGEGQKINSIALETGYYYSLYEAKMQCLDELYKIPSLQVEKYGPSIRDFDMVPFLIINSKILSEKMIIWKGNLEVDNISYSVVLDEETGRILKIDCDKWKSEKYKKIVLDEWKSYIKAANMIQK